VTELDDQFRPTSQHHAAGRTSPLAQTLGSVGLPSSVDGRLNSEKPSSCRRNQMTILCAARPRRARAAVLEKIFSTEKMYP